MAAVLKIPAQRGAGIQQGCFDM
ncbi:Protein of unknown function [Bacillus mycoides]|nr:Protein of unknown function [Bacillus mycoides]